MNVSNAGLVVDFRHTIPVSDTAYYTGGGGGGRICLVLGKEGWIGE